MAAATILIFVAVLHRYGTGLSIARLADTSGYFGRAIQSLVIEKR